MGQAVIVYTKEEARSLEPNKRPICYRVPEKIFTGVFEAVGAASLCWEPKPVGEFRLEQASKFALEILFVIAEELERLGVTFDDLNTKTTNHKEPMTEEMPTPAPAPEPGPPSTEPRPCCPAPQGERPPTQREYEVIQDKQARVMLDSTLQFIKKLPGSRERSLTITKLQEAIMWLGMDLKRLNEDVPGTNPYPNSYNPGNAIVEPTADGLKL